jgi:hypothetical protein
MRQIVHLMDRDEGKATLMTYNFLYSCKAIKEGSKALFIGLFPCLQPVLWFL